MSGGIWKSWLGDGYKMAKVFEYNDGSPAEVIKLRGDLVRQNA